MTKISPELKFKFEKNFTKISPKLKGIFNGPGILYIKTLASGLENKFHCTQWLLLLRGGKIPVKLTKKQVNWKSVVKN